MSERFRSGVSVTVHGMTLIEILVSLVMASLLLVAMWSWYAAHLRSGRHSLSHAQAQGDLVSCIRLLNEDAATLIADANGSIRIEDVHRISLVTASVVPGHPRGFRRVEYAWTAKRGLIRTDQGVSRWLSDRVRLTVQAIPDSTGISCEWAGLADGQPTGASLTTVVIP